MWIPHVTCIEMMCNSRKKTHKQSEVSLMHDTGRGISILQTKTSNSKPCSLVPKSFPGRPTSAEDTPTHELPPHIWPIYKYGMNKNTLLYIAVSLFPSEGKDSITVYRLPDFNSFIRPFHPTLFKNHLRLYRWSTTTIFPVRFENISSKFPEKIVRKW